jgi:hypothetical protein
MSARVNATTATPLARPRVGRAALPQALLFVLTLLLYVATLTQVHTFDALSYVTSVERKPWTEVFHPHHLAYGPLGALALRLAQALGYAGGAALPMQLVNALAGALGVALFFGLARRLTGRADIALAAALLLGGAYAYWYYAVEIEVYTVAALFLIVCLRLLARPGRWTARRALALGGAQAGAVLFHQTNVLLCAPIAVFVVSDLLQTLREEPRAKNQEPRTKNQEPTAQNRFSVLGSWFYRWTVYSLTLILGIGLPYLFVGVVISGFRSWGAFDAWLTEYARTGWWGGPITAQKWAGLGAGLSETLAQPGGALLGLLLLGLLVLHLRHLAAGPRALALALVGWLLVYGVFFLWWEPDNIEFWIASLPPALLLLALALRGERRWGPGIWLALAVGVTAAGVNYDSIARRGDAATDLQRVIARALVARSRPADLMLVPDGLLELYLPYYEQHDNFMSLNQALFDAGDRWDDACAAVRARADAALHAGAAVLVADEVLRPPELLLQRHRLRQEQVTACFAPYGADLEFLALPPNVPAYWRITAGQALAEGSGWRFDRYAEGWQAANVAQERFDQGWHFVPGADPGLTSPLFEIDAERYQAIEIYLANGTHARDAQLFFSGPDGQIGEERSVRWQLRPSSDFERYRVELAGQPGWRGKITRLRFDPVGVGDGGEMVVVSVRLIRARSRAGISRWVACSCWFVVGVRGRLSLISCSGRRAGRARRAAGSYTAPRPRPARPAA